MIQSRVQPKHLAISTKYLEWSKWSSPMEESCRTFIVSSAASVFRHKWLSQTFWSCGLLTKLINKQEMSGWRKLHKAAAFISAIIASNLSISLEVENSYVPHYFQTFWQWLTIFWVEQWQLIRRSFLAFHNALRHFCIHSINIMWSYASQTSSESGFSEGITVHLRSTLDLVHTYN